MPCIAPISAFAIISFAPVMKSAEAIQDHDFRKGYLHQTTSLDEMSEPDGTVKSIWQPLLEQLSTWPLGHIGERQREIWRHLKENGVNFNVHNDPKGLNRPWKLDLLPLIVEEKEWKALEERLIQRANLLDLIYEDLYGEQRLLKEGVLPMELIYQHSGFLRPCTGIRQAGSKQLLFYAADIGRGLDGRTWAISDRTQAPSGIGYALENRSILSRTVPEFFRQYPIMGHQEFFEQYREALQLVSPRPQDEARVVILTPGPLNETYFEHAILASYLGYTLVQGSDLVVIDGRVWIKTVKGLEQVDVIVRRVDAGFCDPLELYPYSQLGVPGLLEVVRRGNVTVVNPLGSGVIENPAINAFMANIARFFLQQDLLMPTLATWWCGQEAERQYVLDHLPELIVKCTDRQFSSKTYFGSLMSKPELAELKAQILANPAYFVGQEQVAFSTAPSFSDSQLVPRHSVLRSFLICEGSGYAVFPGGMTRSAAEEGSYYVSQRYGGMSKDTWVIASSDHQRTAHLPMRVSVLRHQSVGLSSRTAENQYWTARYAVRALETARMLRLIFQRFGERHTFREEEKAAFNNLLFAITHLTMAYPGFLGEKGQPDKVQAPETELLALTTDVKRAGTLGYTLQALGHSGSTVQEMMSQDAWRLFNKVRDFHHRIQRNPKQSAHSITKVLEKLVVQLLAFLGLNAQTLSREQGIILFKIGQRIEQALLTCSLLRSNLVFRQESSTEYILLEDLLILTESLHTYRVRYRAAPSYLPVLHLLLLDPGNPRSIRYQTRKLLELFHDLAGPEQRHVIEIAQMADILLHEATIESLEDMTEDGLIRQNLEQLLSRLSQHLTDMAVVLGNAFFNHSKPRYAV